jgi:hypothetical protein
MHCQIEVLMSQGSQRRWRAVKPGSLSRATIAGGRNAAGLIAIRRRTRSGNAIFQSCIVSTTAYPRIARTTATQCVSTCIALPVAERARDAGRALFAALAEPRVSALWVTIPRAGENVPLAGGTRSRVPPAASLRSRSCGCPFNRSAGLRMVSADAPPIRHFLEMAAYGRGRWVCDPWPSRPRRAPQERRPRPGRAMSCICLQRFIENLWESA